MQVSWWWIISAFICLKTFLFHLSFWKMFLLDIDSRLVIWSFQFFEDLFHYLLGNEISSAILIFVPLYIMCSCSLATFKIFLLVLSNLDYGIFGIVFFIFLAHRVHQPMDLWICSFYQTWKNVGHSIFLKTILLGMFEVYNILLATYR